MERDRPVRAGASGPARGSAETRRGRDPALDRRLGRGRLGSQTHTQAPVRADPADRNLRAQLTTLGKRGETKPSAVGPRAHRHPAPKHWGSPWGRPAWAQLETVPGDWNERCTPRRGVIGEGSGAPQQNLTHGRRPELGLTEALQQIL
ncbi:hypothetical protein NDU88_009820 [Pleurodeles waltl]|uniref:Uncharacterized protein n=1 Tax=Pleurodeles waltl TaxID=8319 RepID=A0AAV7PWA6_PLEWA|nr:hypothetical protein NDU88_009820 [Pleurodeles waltl]